MLPILSDFYCVRLPQFAAKRLAGKWGHVMLYGRVSVMVLPLVLVFAALKKAVGSVYVLLPTVPVKVQPSAIMNVGETFSICKSV